MPVDPEAFRKKLRQSLKEGRESFEEAHTEEVRRLLGLAADELSKITPDVSEEGVYKQLETIVEEARAENLSQAQIVARITSLGETGIRVAKRVVSLAKLIA